MIRSPLPPDFAWRRGSISEAKTTSWLYCGEAPVALVAFHNDLWRTSVNRHCEFSRERRASTRTEDLAVAWVERWASSQAARIRREVAADPRYAAKMTRGDN